MTCRLTDLRRKEVISIKDGTRLGTVCDAELDSQNACLTAIVIYGKPHFFGLFGREEDIVISWKEIRIIGEDTILVEHEHRYRPKKKKNFLALLFGES